MAHFRRPNIRVNEAVGSQSRAAAALIVLEVEKGKSLTTSLANLTKDLNDKDKALVSEIVYGTLRHRRLLNETLKKYLEHKIEERFAAARCLILCALYQLTFMKVPIHAVVSASVGACALCHVKPLANLVNAILRRFLREGAHLVHQEKKQIEFSFPDWLFNRIVKDYGEDMALDIMKNSNIKAPMFLRLNSKVDTKEYLEKLAKLEIEAIEVTEIPHCIELVKPCPIYELPFYKEGLIVAQDLATQEVAYLLELEHAHKVLDCCAAPGMKSAHIYDLNNNLDITALDIDEKRLQSAKELFSRLKAQATFKLIDASNLKELHDTYDRILVDAPCSGTAVIRRHPDIKWLRREKDIEKLCLTQDKILDEAFEHLESKGIMLYSTCSILKCENEDRVNAFLNRHKNAKLLPFKMSIMDKASGIYQRIPGINNADGFFYSRIIKL